MARNQSLDVLRAAAVLLVFCYHSEGALLVSRFGWVGVDLFFVLSGYLVSGLLFREYRTSGQMCIGRFLVRRGFKIYPQFYLLLAATFLWAIPKGGLSTPSLLAEVAFYQNYVRGLWTHTWSLAVEEHFYLLLAAVFWMLARRGDPDRFARLPQAVAVLALAAVALRTALWLARPQITELTHVFPSHLRMDSFLGGVLVAYYENFEPEKLAGWARRAGTWLPQATMLLLSPVTFLTREDPFLVTAGFTMISWAFVLLLVNTLHPLKPAPAPGLGLRMMSRLGRNSYAFYLWHAPVILLSDALRPELDRQGVEIPLILNLLLTFAVSCLAAGLTTALVEAPMLRLRDRWFPSLSPAASTGQAPVSRLHRDEADADGRAHA